MQYGKFVIGCPTDLTVGAVWFALCILKKNHGQYIGAVILSEDDCMPKLLGQIFNQEYS